MTVSQFRRTLVLMVLVWTGLASGCAGYSQHRDGLRLVRNGQYAAAIASLEAASHASPGNVQYRRDLLVYRDRVLNELLESAVRLTDRGGLDEAEKVYQQMLQIDPANSRGQEGLVNVQRLRHARRLAEEANERAHAGDKEGAHALAEEALELNPASKEMKRLKESVEEGRHTPALTSYLASAVSSKHVTIEFRDTPLRMAFDMLSRSSGINFILDRDVRPDVRASLVAHDLPLDEVLDQMLEINNLEKKALGPTAILVYPRTAEKAKEFQDLIVRSFHLANADPHQVQSTLKTLLKTRECVVDDKLNLVIVRDSAEAVELAAKLIALQDLAEPEVMLEVEVIEVQRDRLTELGIQYPHQMSLTPLSASGGTSLTLDDLRHIATSRVAAGVGSVLVNARGEDSDVDILANPRIRVHNREKAKILIGEKVPIITTTATSTGFVSDNVQYVDVGLKLAVEPAIYLHDEVGIKLDLEVSSITQQVKTASGSLAYEIGTRDATTVLRLQDGETQILGGLINDSDSKTVTKVPGLGDLPLLGRLFGSHLKNRQKTEVLLSITPHVLRSLARPDGLADVFWSGSENALKLKPVLASAPAPAAAERPRNDGGSTLLPQVAQSSEKAAVKLMWDAQGDAQAGQTLTVALKVRSDLALRGFPLRIDFDASALQVDDVKEGAFFQQNDGKTAFNRQIDNTTGTILVALSRVDGGAAKGEDSLIRITVRQKGTKAATLRVASSLAVGQEMSTIEVPPPPAFSVPGGS